MSLFAHLATGTTTLCHCWDLSRHDGRVLAFTDHDRDLAFAGRTYRAATGMSVRALTQATGLSVDNSEGYGALSSEAITAEDIAAGRYDGARVRLWLVNWSSTEQRALRFAGAIGEIREGAGAFHAELRGLTDLLGKVQTRSYQTMCPAVLGDCACAVDLSDPAYGAKGPLLAGGDGRRFVLGGLEAYAARWFERGTIAITSGRGAGQTAVIKRETGLGSGQRRFDLWAPLAVPPAPGDLVRLTAGCDKRPETCRIKFGNFNNFRGFPHVPGEDWLAAVPKGASDEDGGSRHGAGGVRP